MTTAEFIQRYKSAQEARKKISGLDEQIYLVAYKIEKHRELLDRGIRRVIESWQLVLDDLLNAKTVSEDPQYDLDRFRTYFELFKSMLEYRQTCPDSERTV